jgi:hypothetical protein
MRARASTGKIRQTYAFIKAHRNRFDIRLAIARCRHGFVLQKDRRVVGAADDSPRARTRRSVDDRTRPSPMQNCYAFQPRFALWQRRLAEILQERIKKKIHRTRELAQAEISECINLFYNPTRRHSHLGGVSPDEFERAGRRRRRVH